MGTSEDGYLCENLWWVFKKFIMLKGSSTGLKDSLPCEEGYMICERSESGLKPHYKWLPMYSAGQILIDTLKKTICGWLKANIIIEFGLKSMQLP